MTPLIFRTVTGEFDRSGTNENSIVDLREGTIYNHEHLSKQFVAGLQ